ncbi:MAG: mandelate racemase/muconate lactonizing enzyme family protein [Azospirillaceae bacterium]
MPDVMRIERIETIPLRMPLPRTFKGSNYFMTHRCTILTRVYTDAGIVGEAYNGDEDESQAAILAIIHDEIAPRLVGRNAFNVEDCWEAMLPATRNILRPRLYGTSAQACVDSAIWDAVGKARGVSLARLWGGGADRLPVVCIAGYYEEGKGLQELGREMASLKEAGFAGCKFKVGGRSPREDSERVRIARDAVGDDFVLTIDANQGYAVRDAIDLVRRIEDCAITWFEEPVQWRDDRRGMALLRAVTGMPVAAGQSEVSLAACRDLMVDGAIDYCNFDASWGGGATEWRRVAALAYAFSVKMAHHEEPQISAQMLASVPHGSFLEVFHHDRDPMFYELVENRSAFSGGYYEVPTGPGWGLVLDEGTIARHRIDQ